MKMLRANRGGVWVLLEAPPQSTKGRIGGVVSVVSLVEKEEEQYLQGLCWRRVEEEEAIAAVDPTT